MLKDENHLNKAKKELFKQALVKNNKIVLKYIIYVVKTNFKIISLQYLEALVLIKIKF